MRGFWLASIASMALYGCTVTPEYAAQQEAERSCKHLINADKDYKQYSECKLNTYGAIYPAYQQQAIANREALRDVSAAMGDLSDSMSAHAPARPIHCNTTSTSTGSIATCY